MKFIDANVQLGRRCLPLEGSPYTTEDILEVMDRCQIESAIAYHAIAEEGGMMDGNMEILKITGANTRFMPQWCAMPSAFGEFPAPEVLFAQMKTHGVKSLRLLPKTGGYSLRPYALQKLMDAAAQCHVPVFLDANVQIESKDTYDLCKNYPDVNFIFSRLSYRENRTIAPIMEQCPNFHIGTGIFAVNDGLELFCRHFGAKRLVFDTCLPTGSATAAVSLVNYAEISQEEKELIAHGNIERLLADVTL